MSVQHDPTVFLFGCETGPFCQAQEKDNSSTFLTQTSTSGASDVDDSDAEKDAEIAIRCLLMAGFNNAFISRI